MNDLPNTAIGTLSLMPSTKDEVDRFAAQLIRSVEEGQVNPLGLKATLKMIEKVIEKVDKATRDNQMTEALKYQKTFNAYGFEIQRTEVGTEYDYLSCGDTVYEQRHAAVESAKSLLKDREAFLRSLREPLTVVDENSGEVSTINPPLKKSTTGLKFSLK